MNIQIRCEASKRSLSIPVALADKHYRAVPASSTIVRQKDATKQY